MFEETPKVEFTVQENGITVYRDTIIYDSMAELRADSKEEREAKFQARYDQWKATIAQMTEEANTNQEEQTPVEEV